VNARWFCTLGIAARQHRSVPLGPFVAVRVSARMPKFDEPSPTGEARLVDANGRPALLTTIDGGEQLVALDVRDGRIHGIFAVLNPDMLTYVLV
jgi:hypothetical protein